MQVFMILVALSCSTVYLVLAWTTLVPPILGAIIGLGSGTK